MALVIAARPRDARLLVRAGDLFYKAKPAVAADYYKRAVEADPANIPARVQLGASLVRSLQVEAALPVLMDVIARDPQNYPAHASLATAFFKEKRYPEAAREFLWIIRSKPELPASYYFLAISLDHLGDCEQANRAYQEFLRRADATANKNEIEEATTRSTQLQRLIKERKCRAVAKGKGK
jgi:tetratricopeptide (TPR) repeat protein